MYFVQMETKESWSSNNDIRLNRLFKKRLIRDKEGHYTMIKRSIQEDDITTINIYTPNLVAPLYIRQMLTVIKGEMDSNSGGF